MHIWTCIGPGDPRPLRRSATHIAARMPQTPDFSDVQTLLLEPEPSLRLVRSSLAAIGFRRIVKGDPATPDLATLELTAFDLILVHATTEETAGFELIQRIRNRRFRTNPFVCAMITAWEPKPALIARAGSAGADGVLAKPFSMTSIRDVVAKFVEQPRPWIAAPGYVGPDRRRDRGMGPDDPVVEVPNTLRMKATGQPVGDVAEQIDRAWEAVAVLRLDRTARVAGEILRRARAEPEADGTGEALLRLIGTMEEVAQRSGATDDPRTTRIAGEIAAILRDALRAPRRLASSLSACITLADLLGAVARTPRAAPAEAGAA
jgi:CheY-like chemotaxis protein